MDREKNVREAKRLRASACEKCPDGGDEKIKVTFPGGLESRQTACSATVRVQCNSCGDRVVKPVSGSHVNCKRFLRKRRNTK